jgi:hypothetical protein
MLVAASALGSGGGHNTQQLVSSDSSVDRRACWLLPLHTVQHTMLPTLLLLVAAVALA